MKIVTVIADDRVGLLADVSYVLGKSNINIEGLFVDILSGKAVICMEVKDPLKAGGTLERNGFKIACPDCIIIKVPKSSDTELSELLDADKIKVTERTILASDNSDVIYGLAVDKPRKAYKVLSPFLLGHLQGE